MFRRRRYLVKKRLQGTYVRMIIFPMFFIALVIAIAQHYLYWAYFGDPHVSSYLKEWNNLDLTRGNLGVNMLLLVVIFALVGILISHRIAGPLYRIEKILKEASEGNIQQRIRLRKNDQLHELASIINQLLNNFVKSIVRFKSSTENISGVMKELKLELDKSSPSFETVRQKVSSIDKELEVLNIESFRFRI